MIASALFMLCAFVIAPTAAAHAASSFQPPQPASADAGVVVLKAYGPSARQWPIGQVLPSNSEFVLRPGDTVFIVHNNWIRIFHGAGRFTAGAPLPPRQRVTVRGCKSCAPRPRPYPDPQAGGMWEHNVDDWGSVCVRPGRGLTLWRESHDRLGHVSFTSAAGGSRKVVDWPAGQRTLQWPGDLPLGDGARYSIDLLGGRDPQPTTIRVLPQLRTDDTRALGAALEERRCHAQFSVLVRERLDPRDREAARGP